MGRKEKRKQSRRGATTANRLSSALICLSIVVVCLTASVSRDVAAAGPSLNQVSGAILNAPAGTIHFVRTGNIYDDSALGFVYAKCSNPPQNMIIQTDSTKINQTTGAPVFSGNMVLFGGCMASKVVDYHEGLGCAPITFSMDVSRFKFMRGAAIAYSVLRSTYDYTKADYFVVQIYMNGSRTIFSIWGIEQTGTYAGGVYFCDVIHPNLSAYTQGYYICKWIDLNNDGIQQSDEITVVASGESTRATIKTLHLGKWIYNQQLRPMFTDEYLAKMKETGFNTVQLFLTGELKGSIYAAINLNYLYQCINKVKQAGLAVWVTPTAFPGHDIPKLPSYPVFKTAFLDFVKTNAQTLQGTGVDYFGLSEVEMLFANQGWSSDDVNKNLIDFMPLAASTIRQVFSGRIILQISGSIWTLSAEAVDAYFKDVDIVGYDIGGEPAPGTSEDDLRRIYQEGYQEFATLAKGKHVPWMVGEYWMYDFVPGTSPPDYVKQNELRNAQIVFDAYLKATPRGVGFAWDDNFTTFTLQPYGEATRQAIKNFFSQL